MRICKCNLTGSAAAVALGLGISSGMAQVTPGQVGDTLKPPEPLRTAPSGQLHRAPSQAPRAAAASDARKIGVDHFVFDGNTVPSPEELKLLGQAYCGKPVPLSDIYTAATLNHDTHSSTG